MTADKSRYRDPLPPIPFREIAQQAQSRAPDILRRWLPGGRFEQDEYVVRNPRRVDKNPGSFRINTTTGVWADFALQDARGSDLIALAQYIFSISAVEAARAVARMIGHEFGQGGKR